MFGCLFGFPRLYFKRILFMIKLSDICRQKGLHLRKNKGILRGIKNSGEDYDFTVDSKTASYCVKIIGIRSRQIYFGFVNEESYEIRDLTFALPCSMDGLKYELRRKAPYRFEDGAERCIVMVGKSVRITARSENGRREIANSDIVPEGRFFFGAGFLEFLKESL